MVDQLLGGIPNFNAISFFFTPLSTSSRIKLLSLMLKHFRFAIFQLQEPKLARLINSLKMREFTSRRLQLLYQNKKFHRKTGLVQMRLHLPLGYFPFQENKKFLERVIIYPAFHTLPTYNTKDKKCSSLEARMKGHEMGLRVKGGGGRCLKRKRRLHFLDEM